MDDTAPPTKVVYLSKKIYPHKKGLMLSTGVFQERIRA